MAEVSAIIEIPRQRYCGSAAVRQGAVGRLTHWSARNNLLQFGGSLACIESKHTLFDGFSLLIDYMNDVRAIGNRSYI
jgi:hypothetical protein